MCSEFEHYSNLLQTFKSQNGLIQLCRIFVISKKLLSPLPLKEDSQKGIFYDVIFHVVIGSSIPDTSRKMTRSFTILRVPLVLERV
jgi:hypothetical protein